MNSRDWVPIRLYQHDNQCWVDWCRLGPARFTDPFFEMTIARRMQDPFAVLFRRQTSIVDLCNSIETEPGLAPSGFIFHFSRCGSTLLSQMFAALRQSIVISEAGPIDAVLRWIGADRDMKIAWLRGMIGAMGRQRAGETRYFVKFDAWHMCEWPLIRGAFPNVPWIFVYRDPIEVLVSQINKPGSWTIPGVLSPATAGLSMNQVAVMPRAEYCARVLATIANSALAAVDAPDSRGVFIDYRDLPDAGWTTVARHFGTELGEHDIQLMRETASFDAKAPGLPFTPDSESKRRSASAKLAQVSDEWLAPLYNRIEKKRLRLPANGG